MQNNGFNPGAASGGGGFEPPRGRTMNPGGGEERKGAAGNGRDSSGEASLTREKNKSKGLRIYNVTDGEFSSFPEIMATSAQ